MQITATWNTLKRAALFTLSVPQMHKYSFRAAIVQGVGERVAGGREHQEVHRGRGVSLGGKK